MGNLVLCCAVEHNKWWCLFVNLASCGCCGVPAGQPSCWAWLCLPLQQLQRPAKLTRGERLCRCQSGMGPGCSTVTSTVVWTCRIALVTHCGTVAASPTPRTHLLLIVPIHPQSHTPIHSHIHCLHVLLRITPPALAATGAAQHPGAGLWPEGHRSHPGSAQLGPCAGTCHVTQGHSILCHAVENHCSVCDGVGPVA